MRTEAVKRRTCPASSSGEMRVPATVAPSHAAPDNEQLQTGVRCTEREHWAVDEGRCVRTLGPQVHYHSTIAEASPSRSGGVPLLVGKRTGAGSHRRILRGGGDSLIHHLLLES
jgi:hypothetical protein